MKYFVTGAVAKLTPLNDDAEMKNTAKKIKNKTKERLQKKREGRERKGSRDDYVIQQRGAQKQIG